MSQSDGGSERSSGSPACAPAMPSSGILEFSKDLFLIIPAYIAGCLGLSLCWMLILLIFVSSWKRKQESKKCRWCQALLLLKSEAKAHCPGFEKAEWLNKTIKQLWPYISSYLEKVVKEKVETAVRASNSQLSTFSFTRIDIGSHPIRLNGIKTYKSQIDRRQIVCDLKISFVGNTRIEITIKKFFCKAGIKNVQMHGTMRVVLEPLLGDLPIIGGISMFFLQRPQLNINWLGLANILDIPGFDFISDAIILNKISDYLVLPNQISIPLISEMQVSRLRFPIPKWFPLSDVTSGELHLKLEWLSPNSSAAKLNEVLASIKAEKDHADALSAALLVLHLDSARNLPISDTCVTRKKIGRMPNPLVVFSLGHVVQESKVKYKTTDPVWEQTFTFLVHNPKIQDLEVEVKDEYNRIGSLTIPLGQLLTNEDLTITQKFALNNSGPDSTLELKMALRILHVDKPILF